MIATVPGQGGLEDHGISGDGRVYWHPTTSQLYSHALARGEAALAEGGPLVVDTGEHTGRSPKDKFIVREPESEGRIWWSDTNAAISEEGFERLRDKVATHLGHGDVYVVDAFAGADPAHRLAVRVISESPWHALFAKTLFIDPTDEELESFEPDALVLHAPSVTAGPDEDGTRSGTFVVLHPSRLEVVIGGTYYAGEIKKSIFTLMNDRLPLEGVFPMHCSANVGDDGSVAVFFGLSGTGKTTLSADPERHLIGDDEHGWGDEGVFNFEGGCYAKVIRLSEEAEPEIDGGYWSAPQISEVRDKGIEVIVPTRNRRRTAPRKLSPKQGPVAERIEKILSSPEGQTLYRRRQQIVEPVLANTKFIRGADRFQRRG